MPVGCLLFVAGVLLTLPASLVAVVAGLAVMTVGFFAVHGVASGWVPTRAHAGGVAAGQAASLYLFAYYLGSSVFGSVTGQAWTVGGWPTVVGLACALVVVSGLLSLFLLRVPSLDPDAADRPAVRARPRRGGSTTTPGPVGRALPARPAPKPPRAKSAAARWRTGSPGRAQGSVRGQHAATVVVPQPDVHDVFVTFSPRRGSPA